MKELCRFQPSLISQLKVYVIPWKHRAVSPIDATVDMMVFIPTFDW